MIVFLTVGAKSRALAPKSVIEEFFTTITLTLEPGARGSRFPILMGRLYRGSLNTYEAPAALRELQQIEEALRTMPVSAIVWTPAELDHGDDPAQPVNHRASNVFEYFVDVDGQSLISRLREGVEQSIATGQALRVEALGDTGKSVWIGMAAAALGIGWMWLGHAFFPRVSLSKGYARGDAIPVWTFGMYLVMAGAALGITAPLPAVRDWLFRHFGVTLSLAIAAVVAWLVICAYAGFLSD